jgi:2-phospho-L-lactate guanylyltransferase
MNLWLIVPVKPFGEGKSRLAGMLDVTARAVLSLQLLERVLHMSQTSGRFAGILVISRDRTARRFAADKGLSTLREQGRDLNEALEQARRYVLRAGADAMLVLPADLPLITVEDIERLVVAAIDGTAVVIAPSQDGGTNALLLRPLDAIDFTFGVDSFHRHCAQAENRGLRCTIVESDTLALDVDWPEDLLQLA